MKYTQLQKLLHIDLVDYKEIDGMKLLLRFRIYRESNEESYNELLSVMGGSSIEQDDDRFPLIEIDLIHI